MLLLIVLFARGGIDGLLARLRRALSRCSQIDGLTKRFGGVVASDDIALDVPPGELHAIIGPNGAGKTTLIGQLTGEIAPDAGRIRFAGQRHHRAAGLSAQRARARALVPDHLAVPRLHRARQRGARRAGARRPLVPLLARRAQRDGAARAGARGARARRPRRACRRGRRQPQPRRASPARDRHGARDEAAHAAARRADGRHGAGGIGAHGRRLLRELKQRADHPADRARHGGGVRACRPHHRAGLRPRHRHRRARGHPRQRGGAPGLSRRAGGGGGHA